MDREPVREGSAREERVLAIFGVAAFALLAVQFILAPLFNRGYDRQLLLFLVFLGAAVADMAVTPAMLYPALARRGDRATLVFFLVAGATALSASIMALVYWAVSADLLLSLALHVVALGYLLLMRRAAGSIAARMKGVDPLSPPGEPGPVDHA